MQGLPLDTVRVTGSGLMLGGMLLLLAEAGVAQITIDGSLGTQIFGNCGGAGGLCVIVGGSQQGGNLFHSFEQFSLPNGDIAGFIVAPTVQNAIARVTGRGAGFVSNVNGTIVTLNQNAGGFQLSQSVNFFLLNPNGILLGPRAGINIGGAFLATTAETMQFQDGTAFSTQASTQIPSPLLTVTAPTGLQMGQSPGPIQSRMLVDNELGSRVTDLALIGGDISLNTSRIRLVGQRITLASLGDYGIANLEVRGDRVRSTIPTSSPRRDIQFLDSQVLSPAVRTGDGISLVGQNIVLDRGSVLTGVLAGTGNAKTNQAGEIAIDATGSLQVLASGLIATTVVPNAIGQGGNINIRAADLLVQDATIGTVIEGNGNAGDIEVVADRTLLEGRGAGIRSQVRSTATGNGGGIRVTSPSLLLANGALILTETSGRGDTGPVRVTADQIDLTEGSDIGSQVNSGGRGNSAQVIVNTRALSIALGSLISTSTFGQGNGGDLQVRAETIALEGTGSVIGSQVAFSGTGRSGDVTVVAQRISGLPGAAITASTFGQGNAGNVKVVADDITLLGSEIGSSVGLTGKGRAGDVTVEAGALTLGQGAVVSASTEGQGNAGRIRILADQITVAGTGAGSQFASAIASQVAPTATGQGGDIVIEAQDLQVLAGASISAGTAGQGNGGSIRLVADRITIDGTTPDGQFGSGIGSQVAPTGQGRGGDVTLIADALRISNGATLSSSSFGTGGAGNLEVTARQVGLDRGGITAVSLSGDGANITLNLSESLLMRRNSLISTSAGLVEAGGNGGNIAINSPQGFLITLPNENNDISANAFSGTGGNVTINAFGIYGFLPRSREQLIQALGSSDPGQLNPRLLPSNDITAISQSSPTLNGVVSLNTPNVDPSRGLATLPIKPDTGDRLDDRCRPGSTNSRSRFVRTGRSGMAETPDQGRSSAVDLVDWASLARPTGSVPFVPLSSPVSLESITPRPVVEATHWRRNGQGQVQLLGLTPSPVFWATPPCQPLGPKPVSLLR